MPRNYHARIDSPAAIKLFYHQVSADKLRHSTADRCGAATAMCLDFFHRSNIHIFPKIHCLQNVDQYLQLGLAQAADCREKVSILLDKAFRLLCLIELLHRGILIW